jgi:hypothetical protein
VSNSKIRREAMERARHRLQAEGVEAAIDALISVCRDPKSPAPAKATSGAALLRAGGFFDKDATAPQKEPHEMTFAELAEQSARLERDREAMLTELNEGSAFD